MRYLLCDSPRASTSRGPAAPARAEEFMQLSCTRSRPMALRAGSWLFLCLVPLGGSVPGVAAGSDPPLSDGWTAAGQASEQDFKLTLRVRNSLAQDEAL